MSSEEGHELARRHGCLFVETSAKGNVAVGQAFEELLCKVGKGWCVQGRGGAVAVCPHARCLFMSLGKARGLMRHTRDVCRARHGISLTTTSRT